MKGKGGKKKEEQAQKTLHSSLDASMARTRLWKRSATSSAPCAAPTASSFDEASCMPCASADLATALLALRETDLWLATSLSAELGHVFLLPPCRTLSTSLPCRESPIS